MPGRIVLQALNSGVSKLPATAGQFPQVSGLTMRVAPDAPVDRRVGRTMTLSELFLAIKY